jgi:hypothetical protein
MHSRLLISCPSVVNCHAENDTSSDFALMRGTDVAMASITAVAENAYSFASRRQAAVAPELRDEPVAFCNPATTCWLMQ